MCVPTGDVFACLFHGDVASEGYWTEENVFGGIRVSELRAVLGISEVQRCSMNRAAREQDNTIFL